MNLKLDAEMMAKIKAQLEKEQAEAPTDEIDKALEGAHDIRKNLIAVKGEEFARLAEIGVLIHKQMALNAFLLNGMMDAIEGFEEEHRRMIGDIQATMFARILNHACHIYTKDPDTEFAESLTPWIDRITDAEQNGVKGLAEKFMKGDEE